MNKDRPSSSSEASCIDLNSSFWFMTYPWSFSVIPGYKLPKDKRCVCVVPWTVPGPWKVFFAKDFAKDWIHMYGSHWDAHLLLKNCELLSRKNFSMSQPWKGHRYQRHAKVDGCIVVIFILKGVNENLNICRKHKARKFPLKTCPECSQVRSSLAPWEIQGHLSECRPQLTLATSALVWQRHQRQSGSRWGRSCSSQQTEETPGPSRLS